jgi:amidophosphoribosyltransferase
VTPVDKDYFDHLDRVRGSRKKEAKIELARQAVMQGVADGVDVRIAMGAATASLAGKDGEEVQNLVQRVNGVSVREGEDDQNFDRAEKQQPVRDSQDISLHNLNDHDAE